MSDRLRETRVYIEQLRRERAEAKAARSPDLFSAPAWTEPTSPPPGWREHALELVRQLAVERETFTVEHLRPLVGPTPDFRALGAVLTAASKRHWIRAGAWVQGGRERHGRPIREWISYLYEEAA